MQNFSPSLLLQGALDRQPRWEGTATALGNQISVTASRDVLAWCPSLKQDTEDFGAHEGRKQHFSTTVTYKCTPFSFMPILPHSLSVAQLEQSPDVELTGTLANFSKLPKHTKLFCISGSALALPGMTPPSPTFPGLQILIYLSKSSPGTTPHDPFHTPLHCRGMNSLAVSFLLLRL